jgi:RHS repeat-associated protein
MAATAEERIPALTRSEENFSLAVPFAAVASEHRIGANAARGQKTHQGIFSTNHAVRINAMRAKWSGTHQDSGQWWSETVLGIVIDANGNTLSDPSGKSYTWDFENRLTQAAVPGTNGGTTTFRYDPFGRRIQKSGPLGTTNYLYDGWDLIEEVDNSGNVLARYNDGVGFDQPLSMLRSGTGSFYQSDLLGSITSLSNSSGALANTYSYDSFGKLSASTGTLTNPFQYTGREFDPETGIYEYRMRYYDQNVGRFISEDPINFRGGIDFYAYTLNNPVNWIDPFGLEVQECRRPLKVPGVTTPHTFLYSTDSGTGYGLGPASGWDALTPWSRVPGSIEKDYPYDPSGKLKPHYECSKVSDDNCFEKCVNQKAQDATRKPPSYNLGVYQCDTWANDIERQCTQQCKK